MVTLAGLLPSCSDYAWRSSAAENKYHCTKRILSRALLWLSTQTTANLYIVHLLFTTQELQP